jgi:hypothetical protein
LDRNRRPFEQADARDLDSGQVPEAPRLIGDFIWTYQKLPYHLQAKGEFEYVGRKVVGNRCNESNPDDLTSYCLGVPNKEFRLALVRPFLTGKINVGPNMMIARVYTGQTTENFAVNPQPGSVGPLPVPPKPDCRSRWGTHTFLTQAVTSRIGLAASGIAICYDRPRTRRKTGCACRVANPKPLP